MYSSQLRSLVAPLLHKLHDSLKYNIGQVTWKVSQRITRTISKMAKFDTTPSNSVTKMLQGKNTVYITRYEAIWLWTCVTKDRAYRISV